MVYKQAQKRTSQLNKRLYKQIENVKWVTRRWSPALWLAKKKAVTTAYSICGHLWMAWLECHLCLGEEPEAVVIDTTESCCWQLKPPLHSCTHVEAIDESVQRTSV